MQALEERFWAKVWRCTHRWPCKKCCWPWGTPAQYITPEDCWVAWNLPVRFSDPALDRTYQAHVFAYCLEHGDLLLLPGKAFQICHACDFSRCCNPSHLSLGSPSDNARDRRGKTWAYRLTQTVLLPDGRLIAHVPPRESLEWAKRYDKKRFLEMIYSKAPTHT